MLAVDENEYVAFLDTLFLRITRPCVLPDRVREWRPLESVQPFEPVRCMHWTPSLTHVWARPAATCMAAGPAAAGAARC